MAGGQGPNSNLGEQFNRGSGGPIGNMPMGQRPQYPYGTSYERRCSKKTLIVNINFACVGVFWKNRVVFASDAVFYWIFYLFSL